MTNRDNLPDLAPPNPNVEAIIGIFGRVSTAIWNAPRVVIKGIVELVDDLGIFEDDDDSDGDYSFSRKVS